MLRNWMFLIFVLVVPTSSAWAQRVMFDVGQVVAGVVREDSTAEFDQITFPLSRGMIAPGKKDAFWPAVYQLLLLEGGH